MYYCEKYYIQIQGGLILPHDASHHWVGTGMSLRQLLTLNSSFSKDLPMTYKILKIMGIYEGLNIVPIKLGLP
jgi:hypothetical protein